MMNFEFNSEFKLLILYTGYLTSGVQVVQMRVWQLSVIWSDHGLLSVELM